MGQQFPLQLLLDPPALPGIGMGEGFRPSVDLVDCPSPLGQFLVLGVEGPSGRGYPAAGGLSTAASGPGNGGKRHRSH